MKQDSDRIIFLKKSLVKYFKSLGIEVYTNTKARGHQGFFLKNRIDISKNIGEERIIPTLLHEFAHYIHNKIEPDMFKTGGTLETLFDIEKNGKQEKEKESPQYVILNLFHDLTNKRLSESETISSRHENCFWDLSNFEKELLNITNFVDENSHNHKLKVHKEQVKKKIKAFEAEIKKDYPKFMRSKKFKEFDKYIKKSKARYLLRYDRVKFVSPSFLGLLKKFEVFTIENLERDFPEMPPAFCAYIRLKSAQKKQARISARINKFNKYYSKPTELFARLVEGLYIDKEKTQSLAPHSTTRFFELLESGYYLELQEVFSLISPAFNVLGINRSLTF